MLKVLLTGASGFLGNALLNRLLIDGYACSVAVRSRTESFPSNVQVKKIDSFEHQSQCGEVVTGSEVVVHCAARVHVMKETAIDPLMAFRKINVVGTLNLAREAASAGVKRFIFISSIKVNGESTQLGHPYRADDAPAPSDPYGISKMEAEEGLRRLALETGMEVVIIRPVLIYGPGVKSNFRTMMAWLSRGLPMPLGALRNKRSLVSLDNLVDLIEICLHHPRAANQTFLVSDGMDVSTPELLTHLGIALKKPVRLISVPLVLLNFLATLVGRSSMASRLCGSLQVDIEKTRNLLDWTPPYGMDEALAKTADDFKKKQ
jgi:nucleoside-diphosphate-sugar epimerase